MPLRGTTAEIVSKDVARPASGHRLTDVPRSESAVGDAEQDGDVPPGQSVNSLLTDCVFVGPRCGELSHVLEVRRREPLHGRELRTEVSREAGQDTRSPRAVPRSLEQDRADRPVQVDEVRVRRELRARSSAGDAVSDGAERVGVLPGHGLVDHPPIVHGESVPRPRSGMHGSRQVNAVASPPDRAGRRGARGRRQRTCAVRANRSSVAASTRSTLPPARARRSSGPQPRRCSSAASTGYRDTSRRSGGSTGVPS